MLNCLIARLKLLKQFNDINKKYEIFACSCGCQMFSSVNPVSVFDCYEI